MKHIFTLSTIAFMIVWSNAFSKADDVSGTITDQQNNSVQYANVVLLNATDSSLVKAAITDESGKYIFEDIAPGNYILMAAQIGFDKYSKPVTINSGDAELPVIVMQSGKVNLQEATVSTTRPLIEHHIDKTVVNVENSIVNVGSTLLDILKRSPGVTVDNDGNVSLKGKQGVLIMIDGKPTYLSQTDLTNLLKSLRSDDLSTIEIITNPSAKYDAAGNSGIINIRLKKKQNLGFNGSFHTSYGQGVYPDFSFGPNLNYRSEKFNLFGSYNFWRGYYFEDSHLIRKFKEAESVSIFDQNSFDKARNDNHNVRTGIDYFINNKHTTGFLFRANRSTNDDKTTSTTEVNNTGVVDSAYTTVNKNDSKYTNYTFNLNHVFHIDTLGKELTADIDYATYDNHTDFHFRTDHYSPTNPSYNTYTDLEKSIQPATINIRSAKIDYTHPFSKTIKAEAGVKSSFVETDNDVKYYHIIDGSDVLDSGKTNHFIYEENINAAYVNWSGQFGKFGIQLGLRAEQTVAKGEQIATSQNFKRDYLQLFPSAFTTYKFTDKHEVALNYSRRIDRPAYQQLNPFRYFLDPYTFQEGNPSLEPQFTHSFEFSYTFMGMISAAVNYSQTEDAMTQITKQVDSTRTTYVTTENLASHDNYGFSLSVPFEITKWWMTSNNFNIFNNYYAGIISGGEVSKRLTSFLFNSQNSFRLPKGWSVEVGGFYNSQQIFGTFVLEPQFSINGGVGKAFFNRKLHMRIDINDVFHTELSKSVIKYNNIDATFDQIYDTQFARLHLTYNFGKQTVEQARRRRGGAEDEQNRVRQGR
jgi:iron complex outermembrane recepter protein